MRPTIEVVPPTQTTKVLMESKPLHSMSNIDIENKCSHYKRNCHIRAPCCSEGQFYPCRFCHDEHEDHEINRFQICQVRCLFCQAIGPVTESCSGCGITFAKYFCSVCKFYDNEPHRDIFHCGDCGICRRGKKEDYAHCHTCKCCLHRDANQRHACLENVLGSNCPICLEGLFHSTDNACFLRCGHPVHGRCYRVSFSSAY
jgi:RING finger/CHY zinc finger protein 1